VVFLAGGMLMSALVRRREAPPDRISVVLERVGGAWLVRGLGG
jgi:hypothetical protein